MAPKTPFNREEDEYIIDIFNNSAIVNKKSSIPLDFQVKFNRPTVVSYKTLWSRFISLNKKKSIELNSVNSVATNPVELKIGSSLSSNFFNLKN